MSSRAHHVLLLSAIVCFALNAPAMAQRVSMASASSPIVIHSVHSATIPPIVGVVGSALAPASAGSACAAVCFDATVTVRANTRWQLQAMLTQALDHASIEWVEPRTSISHRLAAGAYLTVATGAESTFQSALPLSFAARGDSGNAATVSAAQLAARLSYRVVPLP